MEDKKKVKNRPKNLIDKFKVLVKNLNVVIPFLGFLYGIFISTISISTSILAENFYGIPKLYFINRVGRDYYLLAIYILVITIIVTVFPILIKMIFKKDKFDKLESGILSLFQAYITLVLLVKIFLGIFVKILSFNRAMILCLLIAAIFFFVFYHYYRNDYGVYSDDNIKIKKNYTKRIKKYMNGVMIYIHTLFIVVTFILGVIFISKQILITPEKILEYETIAVGKSKDNKLEYKIIVSHNKDKVVIMYGDADEKNKKLTIKKGEYRIESIVSEKIVYKKFRNVICK